MKKLVSFLAALSFLFVPAYAVLDSSLYYPDVIIGYPRTSNNVGTRISSGAPVGQGPSSFSAFVFPSHRTDLDVIFTPYSGLFSDVSYNYVWFVFDLNFVSGSSSASEITGAAETGSVSGTSFAVLDIHNQYVSHTSDGRYVIQVLTSVHGYHTKTGRISIELAGNFVPGESIVFTDAYYQYASTVDDAPPLDPANPDAPDGPMSPPTSSDDWLNEQYQGAVNPDLSSGLDNANSGISQIDDFESDLWHELEQYQSDVDPSLFDFDPHFVTSMAWIAHTFASSFDVLGSWKSIITFPMFIGLALFIIGRGSQAADRHLVKVQRQQLRDDIHKYNILKSNNRKSYKSGGSSG